MTEHSEVYIASQLRGFVQGDQVEFVDLPSGMLSDMAVQGVYHDEGDLALTGRLWSEYQRLSHVGAGTTLFMRNRVWEYITYWRYPVDVQHVYE